MNRSRIKTFLKLLISPQGVMTLSLLVMVALLNFWFYHHDWRYDLTANRQFTLSPQTQKLLQELSQDVKVTAFYRTRSAKRQAVENRLEAYRQAAGGQLSYELIDPELKPGLAERFKISLDETLVIESKQGRKDILNAEESTLSTAILTVTRRDKPKVYFLTGHQELPLDDSYSRGGLGVIKESLLQENYNIQPLALSESDYKVPKDARAVILAGPERSLVTAERKALQNYLQGGGRLMVMLQARYDSGLEAILNRYGIQAGNTIVVDPENNLQRDYTVPLITRFQEHPLTEGLTGTAVFFPLARSLQTHEPPAGLELTPLMLTSTKSWGETNLADNALIQQDEADVAGPVSLAMAAEKDKTRLLVIGNAAFISNRFASVLGNRDFFLNGVAWLVGDQERLNIHSRPETDRQLVVSARMLWWAWVIAVGLMPLLFFGVGFWMTWRRR